jgi:branched-chain amino acid transport system substrate-binding protein
MSPSNRRLGAAAIALAAALGAGPALADITVGFSLSLTGGASALGLPTRNSLDLWPREIGGEKLNLIVLDDGGDPTQAVKNVQRLTTENKADIVFASSITPSTLAALRVAHEQATPFIALSPIEIPAGQEHWVFVVPAPVGVMASAVIADIKERKIKTLGFIGYADSWGDVWLAELKKGLAGSGVEITSNERFARADTSVTSQAVKLVSTHPDAIFVAASGTGAGLPQLALKDRGYTGQVYHTQGSCTQDFIRIAGKTAEAVLMPCPPQVVAAALPDSHASKKVALDYGTRYADKFGKDSPAVFGANAFDGMLMVSQAVPQALKAAKPGTAAFRDALRAALEMQREVPGTLGVLNFSPTSHAALDQRARVLVQVQNGAWKVLK